MVIFLTMLLKVFVFFALFLTAAVIGHFILRRLPEGRLKRILSISWQP